jgi:hypothetical protein
MAKAFIKLAKDWQPDDDDPDSQDKRTLLDFLLLHAKGREHAMPLSQVTKEADFERPYTRESLQHTLIVPLRSQGKVFIGTSNKGIYLIEKPEDADTTISFYTTRIRSELHHVRNLKTLARKYHLFSNYKSAKSAAGESAIIYFDESGSPTLQDRATNPFFIVCGVVVEPTRLWYLCHRVARQNGGVGRARGVAPSPAGQPSPTRRCRRRCQSCRGTFPAQVAGAPSRTWERLPATGDRPARW